MKANFKLNKIDNSVSSNNDVDEHLEFDEYLETLPKGWNLWLTRNSSN